MNENEKPKKKRSTLDKIVFGAVIGAAIGSVIGGSVAPDKGKKTRKKIKDKAGKIFKKKKK